MVPDSDRLADIVENVGFDCSRKERAAMAQALIHIDGYDSRLAAIVENVGYDCTRKERASMAQRLLER